jgi:hypothetical protein
VLQLPMGKKVGHLSVQIKERYAGTAVRLYVDKYTPTGKAAKRRLFPTPTDNWEIPESDLRQTQQPGWNRQEPAKVKNQKPSGTQINHFR